MRTLSIARLRGEPVAAMLLLFHRQTVEYVLPAVRVEHRPLQPLTFLITQAMVRAANAGFRAWNWGGTWATQRTLHRFKAGLGGRDQSYCYVITATPDRRAQLRAEREQALAAFPFWYLYPLELLAGGSS